LPSSSSTARIVRHSEPIVQPFEVHGEVPVLQVKAPVAVARERYQRRSTTDQAALEPGLGKSRAAKSQSASEET
jgi:hypothetical protein